MLVEILTKLLLAIVCGIIIGLERELADKPAGVRTTTLITLGACLFTLISLLGFKGENVDISRVAAGIVTGIGFLGAGTIFRSGNQIEGLTTAATIWVAAGIGMLVGLGLYTIAMLSTVLIFIVLVSKPFERKLEWCIRKRFFRKKIKK